MQKLIRTFIAVKADPQPRLLQTIKDLQKAVAGEQVKWVEEDNMHLTLKFLGDTTPEQIERIVEELKAVSRNFSPLTCHLQGVGYFRSSGMPRVLFVKIAGAEILKLLAGELNTRLSCIGFEPGPRTFSPHITLARIKYLRDKKAFYHLVKKYEDLYLQPLYVRELIFYQSVLNATGPVYKKLAVKKLTGIASG